MTNEWSPHPRYRLYTSSASYIPNFKNIEKSLEELEAEICRRFSIPAAVCVPRARTGLYFTCLETIQPGQKVIMSPLTIVDVVNAVLWAGGIPVFADICRESCSIDPENAESLIDHKTAAILITHLHGETARAHVFREICNRRKIRLLEDAAQSFGAIEQGRNLGTIGDAGVYSFGFFKHFSTWRGGMVVSGDRGLIERIRRRVQETPRLSRWQLAMTIASGFVVDSATLPPVFSTITYPVVRRNIFGIDRCLDPEAGAVRSPAIPQDYLPGMRPWQASLGLRQLERVDRDIRARIVHATHYHDGLDGLQGLLKPKRVDDCSNIYIYFPVQMPNRTKILRYAQRRGRGFAAQHLRNCADLPEFREFYRNCPNARAAAAELILLIADVSSLPHDRSPAEHRSHSRVHGFAFLIRWRLQRNLSLL